MKKVITVILILTSFVAIGQDTSYNAKITFNMTDSVENAVTFQRKAFFEAMIYNQRVGSIALQFYIDFYNADGSKKMKSVKGYAREVIVDRNTYVVTSTGNYVGTQAQMLALYGTLNIPGNIDSGYVKLPNSQYYQLSTPCITEYDWFISKIDATNKISTVIKNIGQREAAIGKLD